MKEIERQKLAERLRNELKKQGFIINKYGGTWLIAEHEKNQGIFVYLEIGDWFQPHSGTVYKKVNCFEKIQRCYANSLGFGDNLQHLIGYANSLGFGDNLQPNAIKYVSGVKPGRIYTNELYTVRDNVTDLTRLKTELANDEQKIILNNLQHIEMIQKDIHWEKISKENRLPTILRFHGTDSYFDYDCKNRTILSKDNI